MKKIVVYFTIIFLFPFSFVRAQYQLTALQRLRQSYTDDKHYNDVCWLTSHNSFAYNDPLFTKGGYINPNQMLDINRQLSFGVRGFMVDLYYKNDNLNESIILAHSPEEKGLLGIRFYEQAFSRPFLETIKKWLDNPENNNDIITIHLESYIYNYDKIRKELNEAGLDKYLFDLCEYNDSKIKIIDEEKEEKTGKYETIKRNYCFSNKDDTRIDPNKLLWPTLGKMRQDNKQLVIFSDKSEDVGYGIMHVSNTIETMYDLNKFPECEIREDGRAKKAPLFIINHFYKYESIPSLDMFVDFNKANEYEELHKRVSSCFLQEKQWPNFIAVDNVGKVKVGEREIVIDINNRNITLSNRQQHINNNVNYRLIFVGCGAVTVTLVLYYVLKNYGYVTPYKISLQKQHIV